MFGWLFPITQNAAQKIVLVTIAIVFVTGVVSSCTTVVSIIATYWSGKEKAELETQIKKEQGKTWYENKKRELDLLRKEIQDATSKEEKDRLHEKLLLFLESLNRDLGS